MAIHAYRFRNGVASLLESIKICTHKSNKQLSHSIMTIIRHAQRFKHPDRWGETSFAGGQSTRNRMWVLPYNTRPLTHSLVNSRTWHSGVFATVVKKDRTRIDGRVSELRLLMANRSGWCGCQMKTFHGRAVVGFA